MSPVTKLGARQYIIIFKNGHFCSGGPESRPQRPGRSWVASWASQESASHHTSSHDRRRPPESDGAPRPPELLAFQGLLATHVGLGHPAPTRHALKRWRIRERQAARGAPPGSGGRPGACDDRATRECCWGAVGCPGIDPGASGALRATLQPPRAEMTVF